MFLIVLLMTVSVFAGTDPCSREYFYREKAEGWFWKNICIKEEEEEEEEIPERVEVPWDRIDRLPPSKIREIYNRALDVAIMNPSYENVLEVKKLEDYMVKKARKFAEVAFAVSISDPHLSEVNLRIPTGVSARAVALAEEKRRKKEKLAFYRDRAGLIVAVTKTCPYCREMKRIIETYFIPYSGWEVLYVDVDENREFARRMSVYSVPDVFIAIRGEEPFVLRIATGLVTGEELVDRVLAGIRIYEEGGL